MVPAGVRGRRRASARAGGALLTVGLTPGLHRACMFVVVRPLLRRLRAPRQDGSGASDAGRDRRSCCVGVLLSALATEAIGIHAIFGAFLLGAVIPHDRGWRAS